MVTLAVTVIVCDMPWRPLPARVLYPLSVNLSYSTPCFHTGPRRMFWTVILRQTHWRRVASPPPRVAYLAFLSRNPTFLAPPSARLDWVPQTPDPTLPQQSASCSVCRGRGGSPEGCQEGKAAGTSLWGSHSWAGGSSSCNVWCFFVCVVALDFAGFRCENVLSLKARAQQSSPLLPLNACVTIRCSEYPPSEMPTIPPHLHGRCRPPWKTNPRGLNGLRSHRAPPDCRIPSRQGTARRVFSVYRPILHCFKVQASCTKSCSH